MKKIISYYIVDGEKKLHRESWLNENKKVAKRKLYQEGIISSEAEYHYDEKGRLSKEIEKTVEGGDTSMEYTYDEEDQILTLKNSFAGELFEEEVYEYHPDKTIKRIFQEGKLLKKIEEGLLADESEIIKVYDENEELIESQNSVEISEDTIEVRGYDKDGNATSLIIEKYDDANELIERKVYAQGQGLATHETFIVENGLILQHHKVTDDFEIVSYYDYDEKGNEIKMEVHNSVGETLLIQEMTYNENDLLIEDVLDNLSGLSSFPSSYHMVVEIE